ncbi:hypothetical protein H4R34_000597 [Dimargaris verticillata]|uniref:NADH-ubiquinone oxidoreductase subunit B14.7 n=1 Tax=Dimargaris verticillata TaxID=2761393 RepID=A0A9W8B5X7_9FUNG|nr:hypothetical protein H4R34_000597 [Dimargaris verticillata]
MANSSPVDLDAIRSEKAYTAQNWAENGLTGAGYGLLSGFAASAYLNSAQVHTHGAAGLVTRTGYLMPYLAVVGGIYGVTESVVGNVRQQDDYVNTMVAGGVAGMLAGARRRSIPAMISGLLVVGGFMGAYKYFGGFGNQLAQYSEDELIEQRRTKLQLK